MRWKRNANLITVIVFSVAFAIVTLLNIIGPLHINVSGNINQPGVLTIYSLLYFAGSLILIWGLYVFLRQKPETLFMILMPLVIAIIILEIYLWGWLGSNPAMM